jgi:hypothetical protein
MRLSNLPLYEYAGHERNYSMLNILSGQRAAEKEAARRRLRSSDLCRAGFAVLGPLSDARSHPQWLFPSCADVEHDDGIDESSNLPNRTARHSGKLSIISFNSFI